MNLLDQPVVDQRGVVADGDGWLAVEPWAWLAFETVDLPAGWRRLTLSADSGPMVLDLWGEATGDWASITLHPGQGRLFRSAGGPVQARLWLGEAPGAVQLDALTLAPVSRGSLLLDQARRALRILASGDLGRLSRAIGAATDRGRPVTLRAETPVMTAAPRPLAPSPLRFGVYIEGVDEAARRRALASLPADLVAASLDSSDSRNGSPGVASRSANLDSSDSKTGSPDVQSGPGWFLAGTAGEGPADVWLTLRAGDVLAPDALAQLALAFRRPEVRAIYADETVGGERRFNPGWDDELIRHIDYVGRPVAWRAGVAPPPRLEETADALTALAAAYGPSAVVHWPVALLDRLEDDRAPARREPSPTVPGGRVSVIVPTRDRPELLGPCLDGLLDRTDHPDFELILVDNGTRDAEALRLIDARRDDPRLRVLRIDEPFNYSRLNNAAEAVATGEILVLLNNDVEPLSPDWLSQLAAQAARPEVGAVGPLLLYPDRTVQHAGVALGVGGVAGHPWKGLLESEADTHPRLAWPQRRSALTAACLALRRDVWRRAGGLDETLYPVTLNDVDLCLRIGDLGLALVFDPRTRLIHHETKSRPSDRDASQRARVVAEQNAFRSHWGRRIADDPFYPPGLTRADETGEARER